MKIEFHRNFKKQYKKSTLKVRRQFDEQLHLFIRDSFDPILNNHPLHGKYKGYRSINISGDYRALYKLRDKDVAVFSYLSTHSDLYG